ncbi:MAG TPA: hypothetical protein VK152_02875 [Paludibacter sp.]|nr:hypothetical protein [Paludibacter sp.]
MKRSIFYGSLSLLTAFIFFSCDLLYELQADSTKINFKSQPRTTLDQGDTLLFTGRLIQSYNDSTGEVIFTDSLAVKNMHRYHTVTCFIDSDSLFTFTLTTSTMSSIVDDLVLDYDFHDHKYYFRDGYPGHIQNPEDVNKRNENKLKRANAWNRFVKQLRTEGRVNTLKR